MKQLIALGIGISAHCEGCIAYHVHDAVRAGASRQEILETLGIAIMMGGGPAVVYACQALEALDQFAPRERPAGVSDQEARRGAHRQPTGTRGRKGRDAWKTPFGRPWPEAFWWPSLS